MLVHYTSVEGFKNIISCDSLHMTRSEFMNDPADSKKFGEKIARFLLENGKEKEIVKEELNDGYIDIYNKVPIKSYIDFLQNNINLYVLSFTNKMDEMELWNYYGNGGIQLEVDEEILLSSLASKLTKDEEYLVCSPVIYVDDNISLNNLDLESPISEFNLRSVNNKNIIKEHMNLSDDLWKRLYSINNLGEFVDRFIRDYVYSLNYLSENKMINEQNTAEEILIAVYENQSSMDRKMIFKKDFLIYMIILFATIKSKSYKYEEETRIVYFENTLSEKKARTISYESKTVVGQNYLRPYVEFEEIKLADSLQRIVTSPLTHNIPFDKSLYNNTLAQFIRKYQKISIEIKASNHKCRW